MFDAHVPAKYKTARHGCSTRTAFQQWWYGDNKGRNLGLNAVAGKPREMYNVNPSSFDEMRPGCYDVHERVRDMSAGGQLAGLNFPNWTGFSGQVLSEGPDRDVNLVMIKAYNDWHVDEWCGAYPERFIPCGIIPLFDSNEAAKEVHRLAAKGCHAVTFSENPAALGVPSIHTDYWDPLFAACCDEGTVLACHVGSSSKSSTTSPDAPAVDPDEPVVDDVDVHARRSRVGRVLESLPDAQVLVDRRRHRLDPVRAAAGRAHPRSSLGLDDARVPGGHVADRDLQAQHHVLLHQRSHRREAARRVRHRQAPARAAWPASPATTAWFVA